MTITFLANIMSIIAAVITFILRLYTKKTMFFWFGICFILLIQISFPLLNIFIDGRLHSVPNEKVKASFPKDLDFFDHRIVKFNTSTNFYYDTDDLTANVKLSKIVEKDNKFYLYLIYDIRDKANNSDWLDQRGEIELLEGNLWVGKTDRLNFYFYVNKTALGNAEVYVGIKRVSRGVIIKNLIIKGNAVKFK